MEMNREPGRDSREPDDERRVGFDEARAVELGAVEDAGGGVEEPGLVLALQGEEEDVAKGDVEKQPEGYAKEGEPEKCGTRRFYGRGGQKERTSGRLRWPGQRWG